MGQFDFYGDVNLRDHELKQAALQKETLANLTALLTILSTIGFATDSDRPIVRISTGIKKFLLDADISADSNFGNDGSSLASRSTIKTFVEGLLDATLKKPEAYDPSVTGNYPLTYEGNSIEAGDSFRMTAAQVDIGDGARDVNVEDLLIAIIDGPSATVATGWMVAESNRDQATEALLGVLKLATQVLADAGVDDLTAITPKKLATYLVNKLFSKQFNSAFDTTQTKAIAAVNIGAKRFEVATNVTADLEVGDIIVISGSTGNDGRYSIASFSFATNTEIIVNETIPDATVDGNLSYSKDVVIAHGLGTLDLIMSAKDTSGNLIGVGLKADSTNVTVSASEPLAGRVSVSAKSL